MASIIVVAILVLVVTAALRILERVVHLARQPGVTRGQRLRVDTTVVETNINPTDRQPAYPTDSSPAP